jgi:lipoprotein-releasing system permease protein
MDHLTLLLAWRYLRGSQRTKTISTVMYVVFLSIMIGAAALTLTIAIMQGFEKATYERLQSIHAQVIIRGFGQPLALQTLHTVLSQEFPEVAYTSPNAMHQVILQDPRTDEITTIVAFKGIDPTTEHLVTSLEQKLTGTPATLTELLQGNSIIIGKKLAESLGLLVGDSVNLLFAPHLLSKDVSTRKRTKLMQQRAIIAGFFTTGIEEFDMGLVVGSLSFFEQLFPTIGVTELYAKLKPHVDEATTIMRLQKRLNLEVFSWKELYLPLVSALKLEKYAMTLILALITLVASMNIISLLLILITYKRADIAILQTMGMRLHDIQSIFMIIGMGLAGIAGLVGIMIAAAASWILHAYPCISLPDAYFVTHLPVDFQLSIALGVLAFIIAMSFIAVLLPIRRLHECEIADLLRFNN